MLLSELICAVREDAAYIACGDTNGLSAKAIVRYVREAMCLVNLLAADKMSTAKKVRLCAGSVHSIDGCSTITRVIGQTDATGQLLEELPQYTDKELRIQTRLRKSGFRLSCVDATACVDAQFYIKSVDIVANGKQLVVHPAVPDGASVYILVECSGSLTIGTGDTDIDIPCAWEAAIMQWVLFRVTFPRADDNYTFPRANTHLKLFADLLQVSMTALETANNAIEDNSTSN